MIRINLLPRAEKPRRALPTLRAADVSRVPTILALVLLLEVVAMGGWWGYSQWKLSSLRGQATMLRAEETRLGGLLAERTQFERMKQDLERRFEIVSRLERSQGVPVALMDGILRSVPQGVWLTALDVQPIVAKREEQAAAPAAPGVIERLEQAKERVTQPAQTPPAAQSQAAQRVKDTRTVTEVTGYKVTLRGLALSNFMVADLLENLRKVASFKDVDLYLIERTEVEKVKVMNFTATWGMPL